MSDAFAEWKRQIAELSEKLRERDEELASLRLQSVQDHQVAMDAKSAVARVNFRNRDLESKVAIAEARLAECEARCNHEKMLMRIEIDRLEAEIAKGGTDV